MSKIKAFVIRDFKDAGTGASFAAGSVSDIEKGAFTNYRAAGLVRAATAADLKAARAAPAVAAATED